MNSSHPAPLSLWRKLGYAVGGLGDSLAFNTISFYLLFYLINIADVPPIEAGLLVGTPRAILAPLGALVGPLSDRIRTKWGRRRVFLVSCGPLMGILFFLQFFVPADQGFSAIISFWLVVQFGLNVSMTLTLGAYQAMAAEVTSSSADRMQLVSMQQGFGVLGAILGPSLTIVLVEVLGGAQIGFTRMGLIYGFVIALMFVIVFLSTAPEDESSMYQSSQSLWKEALSIFRLRSFQIQISVAFLVQGVTVMFNAIIIFYLTFVLQVEDLLSVIILVASISSLGSIVFWNWFSRRTRRWAFIAGILLYMGTLIALSVLPKQSPLIWVCTVLIGAGSITTAIFPRAVLADVIADDQRDMGYSRAGLFTGLYGLSTRIGNAVGGTLIGWLLAFIRFSPENPQGLRWMIGFVPSVFLLLMIPCILLFRPSTRSKKLSAS